MIPCEEQSSSIFPLVEQETSQGRQMDRGEVDGAGESEKSASPSDRRKERGVVCVAGRATEDSHKRSATEPSVPLVAMDYGFLGRDTDVDLVGILVLMQRPHRAVEACQVLRKAPKPYAIDCVLAFLDTWGLREVLLKADNEPAIQTPVDAVRVRQGREDDGGKESEVLASVKWCGRERCAKDREAHGNLRVFVLQEKLGYKVDSKSIVLPWLVRHAAYVLSRFVKHDDETVDFKIVLEPRWATGTFLGRTDESDEVIVGTAVGVEFARPFRRRTRDNQWQRDALTAFIGVPWNPRGLAVEAPMASSRRRYITKSLVQQHSETPGCSACFGVSSQHTATCRERFERLINPNATDVMPDNPMSSSAKRAHTLPPPLSQILPPPYVETGTVPLPVPVPEDAMEVNALCEETVDPPDMEAFFDAAGEFHDHITGEILDRDATTAGNQS